MKRILLTTIIAIAFSSLSCFSTQKDEDDVRSYFDSSIHVGESKDDVIRFLESNSIEYGVQPRMIPAPNGKECDWIIAWIEKKSIIHGKYYVQIYLYFDQQNNLLVEYEVLTSFPAAL